MQCPKCGYVMGDFDAACPRCARFGQGMRMATDQPKAADVPKASARCVYCGTMNRYPAGVPLTDVTCGNCGKPMVMKWTGDTTLGVVGFIAVLAVLFFLIRGCFGGDDTSNTATTAPKKDPEISAGVNFTGTQIVVTNQDGFGWTDVRLIINPHGFGKGYEVSVQRIGPGETYTIGVANFAEDDGTRFNPYTHKVKDFQISCDTPTGRAYWYGGYQP